jgi:hypothetical protein
MYIDIDEVKKIAPDAMSVTEYAKTLRPDQPTIVLRDYNEPTTPPFLEKNVKILEIEKEKEALKEVKLPYGVQPNVPAANVINAIKTALGPGGWQLWISDGSYTGYTIDELYLWLKNFDDTDLNVWIAEVFDCDDFAQSIQGAANKFFKGIALGTLWYGDKAGTWGHAVNIFYSYTHNKAFLLEPQNDTFYEFNQKDWAAWLVVI